MSKLGFAEELIKIIMLCVRSVTLKVFINYKDSEIFTSERGLRQRDPLLLYLFLFYTEGLSNLISKYEGERKIQELKVCINSPISYLISFLQMIALSSSKQTNKTINILKKFLKCTREPQVKKINFEKLMLFFSPSCLDKIKSNIKNHFQINKEALNEKYLDLPTMIGKSKNSTFKAIKDRIWK